MRALLSAAGRAFLRAFAAALLTFSFGILSAPNLNATRDIGVAALAGSIAAGLRAIQAYVPQLTVGHYLSSPFGDWVDAFLHGLLGAMVVTVPGMLDAPNLDWSRAAWTGVIVGALTAGLRALQGVADPQDAPRRGAGLTTPPNADQLADSDL